MTNDAAITNVTDTALWVATFRALEGKRADAAFHDPLAAILAGERGRKIARSIPRAASMAWAIVVRTCAIDRLITEALRTGVDTVLNLGAGLDTRPYRMDLPAHIRWIEVDFPNIVQMKTSKLLEHTPICKVERIGMNLSDRPSRNELFARCGSTSKNVLLIAEGVIPYLANEDVASLAGDLLAIPSFRYWILDFDNAGVRKMPRSWTKKLKAAPFLFQVNDWFEFFQQSGWQSRKVISSAEESEHINRPYPFDFPLGLIIHALPKDLSRKVLSASGAVLMEKTDARRRFDSDACT
jgi:methyltransferase (TIGR00027 family)